MISPQDFVEWVSRGGVLFQLSVQAALLPFISLCQGVIIPYAPLDQVWTCDGFCYFYQPVYYLLLGMSYTQQKTMFMRNNILD